MFDNNSRVSCFTYEIDLIKPIQFICNLINQMSLVISPDTGIDILFEDEFITQNIQIQFKKDEAGQDLITLDELSTAIATYYNKFAVEGLNLASTNILIIHQPSKSIFVLNEAKASTTENDQHAADENKGTKEKLLKLIHKKDVLKDLVSKLRNGRLKDSLTASLNIQFSELYYTSIKFIEKKLIDLPYLPLDIFDVNVLEFDPIELQDISLNREKFLSELNIALEPDQEISILRTNNLEENKEIGIVYNGFAFPISATKLKPYIKAEALHIYYWLQIRDVFARVEVRKTEADSETLTVFKSKMKESALNNLLSYLNKNVYLNSNVLTEDNPYFAFFNDVNHIKDLKHLENFNFFISSENGKTALGIYADKKLGDSDSYNLLHWGMNDDGKLKNYRDISVPKIKRLENVYALKPELAFYFLTNYFEDLLQHVISQCTSEYIKNFHLSINNQTLGELDFVIKTDNKICIVEAKTTLNRFVIEKFQEKCFKLIKGFSFLDVKLEFYLIAPYSDNTCETFWNFMEEMDDYNKTRDGLNCTPYNFNIPIPKSRENIITCIAEPEYNKLLTIVNNICQ
ncbi:hypothetical protein BCL90_2414 [Pedobacter alluvionis]|uniref:Uncharacterized protein n=2 Tax=Pedobacter alluvionis TaxID=475253 RepID=A0A497YAR0_9SPHI|nr:hypothetical protein BCL90_2414 [Pedobacter alluvionis]